MSQLEKGSRQDLFMSKLPTKKQIFRHGINRYEDAIAVDVINNTNVDTALELVVPVGDKFATSDDGYVIQKKVERIQNPLHKFNTQNAYHENFSPHFVMTLYFAFSF